eukprot:Awhi_evm2s12481
MVVLGNFNVRIGRRDKLGKNVNPNNNGANMLSWISEHNFVVFLSSDEIGSTQEKKMVSVLLFSISWKSLKDKNIQA